MSGYVIGTGIDFLVNLVRYRISDPKAIYNTVSQEDAGVASGVNNEVFATDYMPVCSGFDTHLRVGRWYYSKVDNDGDASGFRAYVFNIESGYFRIPTGAINATSGDRVKLSYTWLEEQPCEFTDDAIKMYLGDAITTVNNTYYNFGHTFSASHSNNTYTVTPEPTSADLSSYIYAQYASYLIKKQLESEGFGDRIFVRDINITIDTSKGLGDLQKSAKDLIENFKGIIYELKMKGQASAFARIDTYSTYPIDDSTYKYEANYQEDKEFN